METLCHQTLKRYLGYLNTTLRPSSVAHYRVHIGSLLEFLNKHHPDLESFGKLRRTPHIEGWLQSLARRQPPLKNGTRRQFIWNVSRFLEDIREWDWPEAPPPALFRIEDFPPPDHHLPNPLSHEVDSVLIEGLRKKGGLLCQGLVLARWTGLRVGELTRLESNCLIKTPGERYSIRVPLGKLHKERVIPVDAETAALVESMRREQAPHPPFFDPETGRSIELLFYSSKRKPVDRSVLRRKLKVVAKSLGISENVYPHRLRHTYATELLRFGMSLPGVMKLLGHRSLRMTLRYVQVTNEDLGNAYRKAVAKARRQYSSLKVIRAENETADTPGSGNSIDSAFEELVARIQRVRFDHSEPKHRKKLQRVVERLRRMHKEITDLAE